jgi:predicted kinase
MESRQLCQILLSLGKGKNQNQMESRQLLSDIINRETEKIGLYPQKMEKQILFIYPNLPRQGELVVQGHGCKRT